MSRVYFRDELESVATFWRIFRNDGVALGFTSHNRDIVFEGLLHRAAPGMLPSAIRLTAELEADDVEVTGVLSHDSISSEDLRNSRFDGARVAIGVIDWTTLESKTLFNGELGDVGEETGSFAAGLQSAKAGLAIDTVPRTSPTCRAKFCDPSCKLNINQFSRLVRIASNHSTTGRLSFGNIAAPLNLLGGTVRWIDGPHAGISMQIIDADAQGVIVDQQLAETIPPDCRIFLREGCDHTLETCANRFGNAVNFQGEPFLPGNDFLTRYPSGAS